MLEGGKDSTTDLWTLPIGSPCPSPSIAPTPATSSDIAHAHCATTQIAFFTHTVHNKANSIRFAHQALCSPCISTLLKAIQRGYLKGRPNLLVKGVVKYLNPSPASAKGHMNRPRQGIRSTRRHTIAPSSAMPLIAIIGNDTKLDDLGYELNHQHMTHTGANVIADNNSPTDANLFCFAAFADKHTGTVYTNLTRLFPFMSLEENLCFLVVYHYKTNAILVLPISGFSDDIILVAYKQQHELLESKGFNIKLNVMNNQSSVTIK
jgi:hypothetical protein